MTLRRLTLCLCLALSCAVAAPAAAVAAPGGPKARTAAAPGGNGMWIWYVSRSHGGSIDAIARRAQLSGISTVFIKSGDSGRYWSQFNRPLVDALHARGIQVCGWQFVYGDLPYAEASVGAAAVANGADCLIIDAEGHYEGKYAQADQYMRTLRAAVGPDYPLGLAAFPYVHYHPSFPYSVFLGPGMAQYNLPQMYWKTIGTSVRNVFSTTYTYNRAYNRAIMPLGQTYLDPKKKQLRKFRRFAMALGAQGVSWWSWQETNRREWKVLRRRVRPARRPTLSWPTLRVGSRGDLVIWAQQLIAGSGVSSDAPVGGLYGSRTAANVSAFQASRGLPQTGAVDAATWPELLKVTPIYVPWGDPAYASSRSSAPASAEAQSRYELPFTRFGDSLAGSGP